MQEGPMTLLILIIFGFSIVPLLIGISIKRKAVDNNNSCTEKTEGHVIKHAFFYDRQGIYSCEIMYCPVIEYSVDGVSYRVKKKFSGIKKTRVKKPLPRNFKSQAFEDDKGYLNVDIDVDKKSNMLKLAEELWPVNSKALVFYNPNKPKVSYADRPVPPGDNGFFLVGVVNIGIVVLSAIILCVGEAVLD